jgi:hypothetical protein
MSLDYYNLPSSALSMYLVRRTTTAGTLLYSPIRRIPSSSSSSSTTLITTRRLLVKKDEEEANYMQDDVNNNNQEGKNGEYTRVEDGSLLGVAIVFLGSIAILNGDESLIRNDSPCPFG